MDDFPTIVHGAGLTPACFELELTESGMMGNFEQAIRVMEALKAAGFSLSIDDFGLVIRRCPTSNGCLRTPYATIFMAGNLDLKVIAEGVEELAQAEALLGLGCDDAQGYYFGHPVPA